jgi:hypothetical protein
VAISLRADSTLPTWTPGRARAVVAAAAPAPRRRRSRAKPRPPRPRAVIVAELRGLGGVVLEQALLDATAAPVPSLVEWLGRLAGELAVPAPAPATNRELMHAVLGLSRTASADPLAA